MKEPNVDGVAIRGGDVWETRSGESREVTCITPPEVWVRKPTDNNIHFPRDLNGKSLATQPKDDLVKLISRAEPVIPDDAEMEGVIASVVEENAEALALLDDEPELPEDIADQFEANPKYSYADKPKRLLNVYENRGMLSVVSFMPSGGIYHAKHSLDHVEAGKAPIRRKERWERGAFIACNDHEADGVVIDGGMYEATHERNTVTGEIREVGE